MGFMNNFQAKQADIQKTDYQDALQKSLAQNDIVNQGASNQTAGQQQQLAQMLMAQAQGQGPNLASLQGQQAQERMNQQTAGALASQRGMNPALAQRMLMQNRAAGSQNLAQQSALNAAAQQQAAQGQLAGALGTQRGQDIQQALGGFQATTGRTGTLGGLQQAQNQLASQNFNATQQMNADVAKQNAEASNKMAAGLMSGVGSVIGLAGGGEVPGPMSSIGKFMVGAGNSMLGVTPKEKKPLGPYNPMAGATVMDNAQNFNPNVQQAWTGGPIDYTAGGKLPGKAEVSGDSLKNDKVPIMGSPGEIMLPRSVTMHKNAPEEARKFVAALMAKKQLKGKK